ARPRAHPRPPRDEPRRRTGVEVSPGACRNLDEREPCEIGARRIAGQTLTASSYGTALELGELLPHLLARGGDRSRIAPVGRGEEGEAGETEEALGEVEQALELLDADCRARGRLARKERGRGVALLQILDDRARFVEHHAVVGERGNLAVGAARE